MADRRKLGTKDMVMTMSVVLVVVALIALYGSHVSFAPGAQPQQGETPTADVQDGFAHAAQTLGFPVTVPQGVPEDWHPNSLTVSDPDISNDGVTAVGTLQAVRGGWITPQQTFIQLVETAGDTPQTLQSEFGEARAVTASVEAGDATWSVTTGVRSEVAWVRTVDTTEGMTTLLITGNAAEADFRALAEAVVGAR